LAVSWVVNDSFSAPIIYLDLWRSEDSSDSGFGDSY